MTKIYNSYGWTATGTCAVAFCGTAVLILLARGPHETGWIGWHGGAEVLKRERLTDLSPEAITEGKLGIIKEKVVKDQLGLAEQGVGDGLDTSRAEKIKMEQLGPA